MTGVSRAEGVERRLREAVRLMNGAHGRPPMSRTAAARSANVHLRTLTKHLKRVGWRPGGRCARMRVPTLPGGRPQYFSGGVHGGVLPLPLLDGRLRGPRCRAAVARGPVQGEGLDDRGSGDATVQAYRYHGAESRQAQQEADARLPWGGLRASKTTEEYLLPFFHLLEDMVREYRVAPSLL